MQQDILSSTKKVVETAKYVSIDQAAIERFCDSFSMERTATTELGNGAKWNSAQSVGLVCVFNCINFCFWASRDKKKWSTKIDGEILDGATGAFRALEKALEDGVPLLEASYLSNLSREDLAEIFAGNVEIPLLDERVGNLRETGKALTEKFNGSFIKAFKSANGNAIELVNIFVDSFPSFNDYALLDGQKIEFHKRAQLNADMINYRLIRQGEKELADLDKLTAFADYKVPQMLRKFGILKYTPELATRIDTYTEIERNSREEIEIRSATVWAIENMRDTLRPKVPEITAGRLDDHLWSLGQNKSPDEKPYHRTKTIFY